MCCVRPWHVQLGGAHAHVHGGRPQEASPRERFYWGYVWDGTGNRVTAPIRNPANKSFMPSEQVGHNAWPQERPQTCRPLAVCCCLLGLRAAPEGTCTQEPPLQLRRGTPGDAGAPRHGVLRLLLRSSCPTTGSHDRTCGGRQALLASGFMGGHLLTLGLCRPCPGLLMQYADNHYPPFASGCGFVLSFDLVHALLRHPLPDYRLLVRMRVPRGCRAVLHPLLPHWSHLPRRHPCARRCP